MLKKILCILLSAVLVMLSLSGCGKKAEDASAETLDEETFVQPTFTEEAESYKKSETVYVNIDSKGKVLGTSVTDWLHTDKPEVVVNDVSDLENITNIKSDIEPVFDGKAVKWNMDTTDLYYSGTTDKELPVDIAVRYYLDGKAIEPKDIAGKSGKVRIDISMTNKCEKEVTVGGKKATVYLPVLAAGIVILPESEFSGVTVTNGKSIGDGTKEIVAAIGLPGIYESLSISKDDLKELSSFDLSGKCSITAEAENFELTNMYFAVLPLCSLDLGLVVPDNMKDLTNTLQRLKKVLNTVEMLDVDDILSMLVSDSGKVTELTEMVSSAVELYSSNEALIKVLSKYMTEENLEKIKKLVEDMDDSSVNEALELLSNPVIKTFVKDLPVLTEDLGEVMPIIDSLNKDLQDEDVKKAVEALPETLQELKKLQEQLEKNKALIDALGTLVSSDNLDTISELANELSGFDFKEFASKYSSAIEGVDDDLLERAKAWLTFGNEYNIFTSASDNAVVSLAFIYQAKSIVKAEETTTAIAQSEPAEPWYKKIFGKK
ncbi:MAG: hypothetical protein K6F09_05545 [Clostridiales bacterium]|nr:hypothetical protein [Clostridiales bacterium]